MITGAGDAFSAGFDLREFGSVDPAVVDAIWPSSDRFHDAVMRFPLPTVAAVNGVALGGGFDLAVLCDVRIAARSAAFAHAEHTFGDVVYAPLHELVGGAVARDLCLTGRTVDADEALRLGLVSRGRAPTRRSPSAAAAVASRDRSGAARRCSSAPRRRSSPGSASRPAPSTLDLLSATLRTRRRRRAVALGELAERVGNALAVELHRRVADRVVDRTGRGRCPSASSRAVRAAPALDPGRSALAARSSSLVAFVAQRELELLGRPRGEVRHRDGEQGDLVLVGVVVARGAREPDRELGERQGRRERIGQRGRPGDRAHARRTGRAP